MQTPDGLAFQKSPLKYPPLVIESTCPRIAFSGFQESLIIEPFGRLIPPKNIGLLMGKELYSANSNLEAGHADPSRHTSRVIRSPRAD
jgi:hypothetical protein